MVLEVEVERGCSRVNGGGAEGLGSSGEGVGIVAKIY